MSTFQKLSEEDKKIAEELQAYIGGDLFDEPDIETLPEPYVGGNSDIKYVNATSTAISDSNDIRRIIADMLKN
jgi:hypothetical protein